MDFTFSCFMNSMNIFFIYFLLAKKAQ